MVCVYFSSPYRGRKIKRLKDYLLSWAKAHGDYGYGYDVGHDHGGVMVMVMGMVMVMVMVMVMGSW